MIRALDKFIIAFFLISSGCNRIMIKPLSHSFEEAVVCFEPDGKRNTVSFEEDSLNRQHVGSSNYIRLVSDYGSNNKYVKLFGNISDSSQNFTLIFHFTDKYEYDFIKSNIVFKADGILIEKPVHIDPASFIISDISDQYYVVKLTSSEITKIAFSTSSRGRIGPIDFELPFECRAEWKSFLRK